MAGGFNTCLTADNLFTLLISSSFYNFHSSFSAFLGLNASVRTCFHFFWVAQAPPVLCCSSIFLSPVLMAPSSFSFSFIPLSVFLYPLLPCSMLTCRALPCSGGLCRVCCGVPIVSLSLSDTGDHSPFHGHDTICRRCFRPSVFFMM